MTNMHCDAELDADVLIIGAGMAGLTAAARASELGASVIVVEKAAQFGGSAVLSGGGLWTLAGPGLSAEVDPDCNEALCEALPAEFARATEWIAKLGADMLEPMRIDPVQGFPATCRPLDILGYLRLCVATVKDGSGWIVTSATVRELEGDSQGVCGAIVEDRDGTTRIRTRKVILATGGYQANPQMLRDLVGPHAEQLQLRSNPESDGGGITLALGLGAQLAPPNASFYGHLIAHPLEKPFVPADYLRLSQIASPRTLLFNRKGERFIDESRSYYGNASAVALQEEGLAMLVADETVRQYDLTAYAATESIDRFVEAEKAGARVIHAASLAVLNEAAARLGYQGIADGVSGFNRAMASGVPLLPARAGHRRMLVPPFWAMEVAPAITFPFRGLKIDAQARVLGDNDRPIGGLFAAGADGCFYRDTYFGGLALGLVYALRAAETATG